MSFDTTAKNKALSNFLNENLNDLKSKGLYNKIDSLQSSNGPIITINEKNVKSHRPGAPCKSQVGIVK